MTMEISKATLDDVFALARLHIEVEQQAYAHVVPGYIENVVGISGRETIWRLALSDPLYRGYVLTLKNNKGVMIGFLSATIPSGAADHTLKALYILNKYQRAGLGRQLFARYVNDLRIAKISTLRCSVPSRCTSAREFFMWTGGIESLGGIFPTSLGLVQITNITWNNVEQLAKYFDLLS